MANLQDIVAKNKKQQVQARTAGGTLTETSGEELQNLASNAGMAAPPVTPLGAAMLGAGPHQQKMAGTPAQKQAAITMAATPEQDLQTVMRRQQARDQATQQEQQAAQKSENLKQLGGLGDRVHGFINVQRNKLQEQAQQEQLSLNMKAADDSAAVGSLSPDQAASFKQILEQFQQDPSNLELLVQAGNMLGGRAIDPAEIPGLFQSANQVISGQVAGQVADTMSVADLFADEQFGYTPEELSSLLGISAEELQGYSIQDLENKVAELTQAEFAQAAQTQQQVGSSQLGAAERQFARGISREQSAVGVRSTEADMQALEEQIAQGQQVSFGGMQYQLEDLLNDDTITQVVSDYLRNPDSPESRRLVQTEPELMAFITRNQALLADAVAQMEASTTEFGKIQEENKALANVNNVQLDPAIAQALIPGYDQLQSSRIQVDPNSALSYIRQDPVTGEKIVNQLNDLVKLDPQYAQELAGLTGEQLASLGIDKGSAKWKSFTDAVRTNQRLSQLPEDNADAILAEYFGMPVTSEQASQFMRENKNRSALGFGSGQTGLLDSNNDGILDSPDVLLNNLREQTPRPSLEDAIAGNVSKFQKGSMSQPKLGESETQLVNMFGPHLADGKLDTREINQVFGKATSPQEMDLIYAAHRIKGGAKTPETSSALTAALTQAKNRATSSILNSPEITQGSPTAQIQALAGYLNGSTKLGRLPNNAYINTKAIQQKIGDITRGMEDELRAAAARGDERRQKQLVENIGIAAKILMPQLILADALEYLGKITNIPAIQNLGKGMNKEITDISKIGLDTWNKAASGNIGGAVGGAVEEVGKKLDPRKW